MRLPPSLRPSSLPVSSRSLAGALVGADMTRSLSLSRGSRYVFTLLLSFGCSWIGEWGLMLVIWRSDRVHQGFKTFFLFSFLFGGEVCEN